MGFFTFMEKKIKKSYTGLDDLQKRYFYSS